MAFTIHALILAIGSGIMLANLLTAGKLHRELDSLSAERQQAFRLYFTIQRSLTGVFLLGYIATLGALVMNFHLRSELFIALIFFFGSLFVALVVWGQLRLLREMSANP